MILYLLHLFVIIHAAKEEPQSSINDPKSPYYWPKYVKKYNTFYKDLKENDIPRMILYENNVKEIEKWNKLYERGERNFKLGINALTAMTDKELMAYRNKEVKLQPEDKEKAKHKHLEKFTSKSVNNRIGRFFNWVGFWNKIFGIKGSEEDIESLKHTHKTHHHTTTEKTRVTTASTVSVKSTPNSVSSYPEKLPDLSQEVPENFDWRETNFVPSVKFQGYDCASCYAFSSVDCIASHYAIRTGTLVELSSQMVIDCSDDAGNRGCIGGWIGFSFKWLMGKGGLVSEEQYPTTETSGKCEHKNSKLYAPIVDYYAIPQGNADILKAAVYIMGPVAVSLNSKPQTFQRYEGNGIYDDMECNDMILDHTALVVGYGTENGIDYWTIQNSWGTQWGEKGYMRVRRGLCGITSRAYVPILKTPKGGWPHDSFHQNTTKNKDPGPKKGTEDLATQTNYEDLVTQEIENPLCTYDEPPFLRECEH